MAPWHYDRLSAQDNSFLLMERGNVRMHVASTNICDMGPLRTESGGIDIELVKRATMSIIHLVPRYRQRLFEIPVFDHAVWVDDVHFDIDYHIRHTSLPKPGTLAQLKNLVARVMAQPLDRKRPPFRRSSSPRSDSVRARLPADSSSSSTSRSVRPASRSRSSATSASSSPTPRTCARRSRRG